MCGLLIIFFLETIQEIAIDGWAVEMLREENTAYASTALAFGVRFAEAFGSVVFLILSSPEFAQSYIGRKTEILSINDFFFYWAFFVLTLAFIILLFTTEKEVA